jgi:glycosyltransferase involved in cell wall biosynthesis
MSDVSSITVDYTHVNRHVSGIERLTIEQFNEVVLSPLPVRIYRGPRNRLGIAATQMVGLPVHAMRNPSDVYIFPGFPPSPYFSLIAHRSVLFVHDLFLLTRRADLNHTAKYYMAPMFSRAIRKFRYFLTNSEDTLNKLKGRCSPNAIILPYRPSIRNVFGATVGDRLDRPNDPARLRIVSVGTIEPRKNFIGAAKICEALSRRLRCEVELHIIGRAGWGKDVDLLRKYPNVVLHGYLIDTKVRSIIESSDLLLCSSHEEGLCLPLIEAQYSGVAVAAPSAEIFREVLGQSGILIDASSPECAANQIKEAIAAPDWRRRYALRDEENIRRWNDIAHNDRVAVISLLTDLASGRDRTSRKNPAASRLGKLSSP